MNAPKGIILFLVILLVVVAGTVGLPPQACLSKVPLHAKITTNTTDCAWECDAGFFKTEGPYGTCRPCSAATTRCEAGWYLRQCSLWSDTSCAPCPTLDLAGGQMYAAPNTCDIIACRDGFYFFSSGGPNNNNNNNNSCRVCEQGFYCVAGQEPKQCAANCTTAGTGVSNVLECQGGAVDIGFSVSFIVSLPISRAPKPNQTVCPSLDAQMATWMQYGTFFGCGLSFSTPIMGTLACQVSAPPCIAGQYLQWLSQLFVSHQAEISPLVVDCIQSPLLALGVPLIQQQQMLDKKETGSVASAPKNVPLLVYESQAWGGKRGTVLDVLAVTTIICFILLLILVCCCGFMCLARKKKHSARTMYATLLANHRAKSAALKQVVVVSNNNNTIPTTIHSGSKTKKGLRPF